MMLLSHKRVFASFFVLSACWTACRAQETELSIFQEEAGGQSILFRGMEAEQYSVQANGHPYFSSPVFGKGEIVFEGRRYPDITLNIDAVAQRVIVMMPSGLNAVALLPESVEEVLTDGHRYTGVASGAADGLPEGIYEVFGQGPEQVYKHVVKHLSESATPVNGDRIGYFDEHYNPDLIKYYGITTRYYFRDADGHFSRIRGTGALLRKLGDRRKTVRKALRESGLTGPGTDFDQVCRLALTLPSV
ncbi:MAG: hypothetical protein IJV37_03690 [Bacteroidales bacterium]|nr:hypothetical protein [Bacteroidales bacterium]